MASRGDSGWEILRGEALGVVIITKESTPFSYLDFYFLAHPIPECLSQALLLSSLPISYFVS